jgi:hypothetical protein
MKIITGHVSPETAYVVDDYPYGYTLRCKIRYWLEFKKGKGIRFMSQTTNPKRPGEVWNKPKASTYCRFGGCMVVNGDGHVKWTGLTEYCTGAEAKAWADKYGAGVPEAAKEALKMWVAAKLAYDARTKGDFVAIEMKPTAEGVTEIHDVIKDAIGE